MSHAQAADDVQVRAGLVEQIRLPGGIAHDLPSIIGVDLPQVELLLANTADLAAGGDDLELLGEDAFDHLRLFGQSDTKGKAKSLEACLAREEHDLQQPRRLAVVLPFDLRGRSV